MDQPQMIEIKNLVVKHPMKRFRSRPVCSEMSNNEEKDRNVIYHTSNWRLPHRTKPAIIQDKEGRIFSFNDDTQYGDRAPMKIKGRAWAVRIHGHEKDLKKAYLEMTRRLNRDSETIK